MRRSNYQLFRDYAELLRRAWLNPSYKPWQQDVHDFEHENDGRLKATFSEWQKNA